MQWGRGSPENLWGFLRKKGGCGVWTPFSLHLQGSGQVSCSLSFVVPARGQCPRGFPGPAGDSWGLRDLIGKTRSALPGGGVLSTQARPGPPKVAESCPSLAWERHGTTDRQADGHLREPGPVVIEFGPDAALPPRMPPEHKVIIVGLDNAGKTTILYQLLMNEVVHTSPTIGSNVEEIVLQKTHFLVWDIGGQEALRSTWDTYYANTEFIILVIDSTDRDRLRTTREELYKMLAHEALRDASVLIFANKQDMKNSMTTVEISQFLTLSTIKDHPWHIQGCCALTGEGGIAAGCGPRCLETLGRSAQGTTRFWQCPCRSLPQPTSITSAGLLPAGLQWMKSQATAN
ncbi:putative ADP-ribosylation factor-like protein 5C isoform X2 [Ursus maritimus]|uniref:ADP-ribosylation factor-like protein 5C isoform X2 n=1 Tax=Ursus maritimus TaxID=29073 RepID=A0A8M1GLR9_URSMA|nr:putative ADP-ribosylation factor-like protein 5C isoform X2 [Ursus maritimus]